MVKESIYISNNTCHAYPWKRKSVGFFMSEKNYCLKKPVLNIEQQLELLIKRGLIVKNRNRVRHYLKFIGYYRLSGYCRFFQQLSSKEHLFLPTTTFDDILNVYIFDRKLRLLVMDAIERIEVAIRATISNTMSEKYGSHWYLEAKYFGSRFNHNDFIEQVKRETGYNKAQKQNDSCKHYYQEYTSPFLPPSWMIAEVLSIGNWSNIYSNLKFQKDQKEISNFYGLPPIIMRSWLHSLTYLRNLCAHHARVWNKNFTIKPKKAIKYHSHLKNNNLFYAQAVCLNVFLYVIADGTKWQNRLFDLLKEYPDIPLKDMGFPDDWYQDPFWRIQIKQN